MAAHFNIIIPVEQFLSEIKDIIIHHSYCIEGKGGREDNNSIEIIKLRRVSKKPAKEIEKFFNALQGRFMKSNRINQGLKMGHYLYDKIYYLETGKNMYDDLSKRQMKYIK